MDKNLLVLSHSYANFIKDPLEKMTNDFSKISCIVRLNPIADISKFVPIDFLKPYSTKAKLDFYKKPDNISIFPLRIFYLPTDSEYVRLMDKHYRKVEETISKNNLTFDLIHAHFVVSSGYVGARLKEKYGIPLVITAHGYDIYSQPFKSKSWEERTKKILNTADYILTVSDTNLSCIKRLNIKRPVKVLPNGFNGDLFHPAEKEKSRRLLNLPPDKKILVSIGELKAIKGQIYLIEAMKKVVSTNKDVICLIIGDGDLKNYFRKQIQSFGLTNNVILTGAVPHQMIPQYINASDLFVLPSLQEGNPTVMFECLGCGKPFIGTRVGGTPEVIKSRDYGLLVSPKNSAELADAIIRGLEAPWDQELITDYSRQFEWGIISSEIVKIYKDLIGKTKR